MDNHVWKAGTGFHRLYVFCLSIWATFVRRHRWERELYVESRKLNTDICFLAKVIPGALLVVVLNIIAYLSIPTAVILSFILLGATTIITFVLSFMGIVGLFILCVFVAYLSLEKYDAGKMCKMYYRSIKERACFLIRFNQKGESDHV